MTGAYLRVLRDGKWQALEVEYLTDTERNEIFSNKQHDELVRWINILCDNIKLLPEEILG